MRKSRISTRVLVVDGHPLLRQGIASCLACEKDMAVVGEANDIAEALALLPSLRPDVVVMEALQPDVLGRHAIVAIAELDSRVRVIVLTALSGDLRVRRALAAGARAYLLKSGVKADLADAIRAVMDGAIVIDSVVTSQLNARSQTEELSERELQVLRFVESGLSNRMIGERLEVSEGTVKNHLKRISRKLGANDRTHAVVVGIVRGALDGL